MNDDFTKTIDKKKEETEKGYWKSRKIRIMKIIHRPYLNLKIFSFHSSMKKTNIFICPKSNVGETGDYKQVFTDIISDRIQEKYK